MAVCHQNLTSHLFRKKTIITQAFLCHLPSGNLFFLITQGLTDGIYGEDFVRIFDLKNRSFLK